MVTPTLVDCWLVHSWVEQMELLNQLLMEQQAIQFLLLSFQIPSKIINIIKIIKYSSNMVLLPLLWFSVFSDFLHFHLQSVPFSPPKLGLLHHYYYHSFQLRKQLHLPHWRFRWWKHFHWLIFHPSLLQLLFGPFRSRAPNLNSRSRRGSS